MFISLNGLLSYAEAKAKDKKSEYQTISKSVVHIRNSDLDQALAFSPVSNKGMASGFFVDRMGHVITSWQAIKGLKIIEVVLSDGQKWPVKILGHDERSDIAVIEMVAPEKELLSKRPLKLSKNIEVEPGTKIFSISNPFGIGFNVLNGVIISGLRSVAIPDKTVLDGIIETDLPLTPGDAGSPVFDSSGRLMGMNTMIFDPQAKNWMRSFAVSSEIMDSAVFKIIDRGKTEWAWLGAKFITVTSGLAMILDLPVNSGVMLTEVVRGGPAEKAGLKGAEEKIKIRSDIYPAGGDILVSVDKKNVGSASDLLRILRYKAPGDVLEVRFYRDEKLKKTKITLGKAKPTDH